MALPFAVSRSRDLAAFAWRAFLVALMGLLAASLLLAEPAPPAWTTVTIVGEDFHFNGKPTLEGKTWRGYRVEGLLPNARMVQGVFDDLNPQTRGRWAYPDTKAWDPERNTREFVAAMSEWRKRGLLAFSLNLQGGSPEGISTNPPWHNSAFEPDGSLRPDLPQAPTLRPPRSKN